MENLPTTLAEDIALLSLLSTVPEEPAENAPNNEVRLNNQQQRSLTFERERDLVDNLAFLSADTDDPEKVTAVCVEENSDAVGLTIVLAVNKGTLANVKARFEKMAKILERVATQNEFNDTEKSLLHGIISLCEGRILSRLRSKHAEISIRNHLKPSLNDGLAKVMRMVNPSQMPLDTDILAIRAAVQRFQDLFRSLEHHDLGTEGRHQLLSDLTECAQTLTTDLKIDRLISSLPNRADFGPNRAASLIGGLRKVGRYSSASQFLLRAARRLPIFKTINVKVVVLPAVSRSPNLLSYSPDLAPTMKRINANVDHNQTQKILWPKSTVFGASFAYKFNRSTQKILKAAKVHAEIQLIYHYEVHPVPNLPRVICSSKSACFLCDKFIKHHGKFFIARTHGRLYPQWRLPDLACMKLSEIRREQQTAVVMNFKNDLEEKVRILLSRRDRLSHSHPNESVFIQPPLWTPSNTSLGREVTSVSRIRTPETSPALEIAPRESISVSATQSEMTVRATDSTTNQVREGFRGTILKGEGSCQVLLDAQQDLSFFAGSIHLVVGIAEEWSDLSFMCTVEFKWLSESESAQLRKCGERNITNAIEIPQDKEITSGNRTEKVPTIVYVSLGSEIVSVEFTLANEKNTR